MYMDIAAVFTTHPVPEPRIRAACALADALRARLTGLHVHLLEEPPLREIFSGPAGPLGGPVPSPAAASAAGKSLFEAICRSAGVEARWQDLADPATQRIAAAARCADLTVLFAADGTDKRYANAVDIPGVIVESGRPALLLPALAPVPDVPFRRILIAWNDSREATRALHDAMPLLRQAERIVIASATADAVFDPDTLLRPDLETHLHRHGVRAGVERVMVTDTEPGEMLTALADTLPADLIVAGCYGHARLTEFLLGGVSRRLLRNPAVPLLLSY